jgi:hypothetical protein
VRFPNTVLTLCTFWHLGLSSHKKGIYNLAGYPVGLAITGSSEREGGRGADSCRSWKSLFIRLCLHILYNIPHISNTTVCTCTVQSQSDICLTLIVLDEVQIDLANIDVKEGKLLMYFFYYKYLVLQKCLAYLFELHTLCKKNDILTYDTFWWFNIKIQPWCHPAPQGFLLDFTVLSPHLKSTHARDFHSLFLNFFLHLSLSNRYKTQYG